MSDEESEVVGPSMLTDLLVTATCCRDWPVSPLARMGRCGLCGETPRIQESR